MRRFAKRARLAFAALIIVQLTACQSPPSTTAGAADPVHPADLPQNIVLQHLGPGLVFATPIVDESTASSPMRVTTPVRSVVDQQLNIQFRYEFFDRSGRPLDSNQGWRFMHIDPLDQVHLDGNAMESAADDWRLYVRPAR